MLALKAGTLDLVQQLSAQEASSFANNSRYQTWEVKTSNHREIGMRVDIDPFKDPRVRRAVALTLDRPGMIKTLFEGRGVLGNDNPIWTGYPSHDPSVKQRVQNITLAKALLAAAGKSNLSFTITTYKTQEIPDLAQIIQSDAKEAGLNITLEFLSCCRLLRLGARGRLPDDHAVAEPALRDHRLRPSRDPERVPDLGVRDRRCLEPVALFEPEVRRRREVVHRGG